MRSIPAAKFKATCLAVLDEVARTGERVVILKRGRPVAVLGPPLEESGRYPQDALKGTVQILGDVLSPALPAENWEAESRKRVP